MTSGLGIWAVHDPGVDLAGVTSRSSDGVAAQIDPDPTASAAGRRAYTGSGVVWRVFGMKSARYAGGPDWERKSLEESDFHHARRRGRATNERGPAFARRAEAEAVLRMGSCGSS